MTAKKKTKKPAPKRKAAQARAVEFEPGTVIERIYKGETVRLRVTDTGFAIGKKTFTSLTAAAKHVTGYKSISGVRFWLGQADDGAQA